VEAAGLTFPLTLADELLLEKSSLREQIEQWPDPEQRQRLLELEKEEPATLTEAVAWLRRVWQVVSADASAARPDESPAWLLPYIERDQGLPPGSLVLWPPGCPGCDLCRPARSK
jgi:hypothetical protein